MRIIKILGTGCPKCKQTEVVVRQAVAELGVQATIEKVEDIMQIMTYNVMRTPAVVIDEEVKISGRVPAKNEVKALLN